MEGTYMKPPSRAAIRAEQAMPLKGAGRGSRLMITAGVNDLAPIQ